MQAAAAAAAAAVTAGRFACCTSTTTCKLAAAAGIQNRPLLPPAWLGCGCRSARSEVLLRQREVAAVLAQERRQLEERAGALVAHQEEFETLQLSRHAAVQEAERWVAPQPRGALQGQAYRTDIFKIWAVPRLSHGLTAAGTQRHCSAGMLSPSCCAPPWLRQAAEGAGGPDHPGARGHCRRRRAT